MSEMPPPRPPSTIIRKNKSSIVKPPEAGAHMDSTKVRRSMADSGQGPRGVPLRQKIMIAMAAVTVVTSVLIFVVVYSRTLRLLDREIDAKGVRLAQMLAAMDKAYWKMAMPTDAEPRRQECDRLLADVFAPWKDTRASVLKAHPDLQKAYDLLTARPGSESKAAAMAMIESLLRAAGTADPETELRKRFADPDWKRRFEKLFDPGVAFRPLKTDEVDLKKGGEILQVSVLTLDATGKPLASVQIDDRQMGLSEQVLHGSQDGVEIHDGKLLEGDSGGRTSAPEARSFKLDLPHDGGKLRFYVILSLEHIIAARTNLLLVILPAICLSVGVGLSIAWWISRRITDPVLVLIDDINQVSAGNLDHQTSAHSNDEIGVLALTFNRMTSALRLAHDQELEAKALEHELNIASEIQANLVPKKIVRLDSFDVGAYYRPSKEVGGDYYDFLEIDPRHLGIVVADVSGKGVPGSLVMAMARAFIRMEAERGQNVSPSDTLKRVNKMLAQDIKKGMFVTAIYGILDLEEGSITVASAGHNPMIVWRSATNAIELVNPKGIALGFDRGPVFDRTVSEEKVMLQRGDRLLLYTDGTVEAMNEKDEEFGDEAFSALTIRLATKPSSEFLSLMVKALDAHQGKGPQHDDMTIVTLRYM